MMERRVVTFLMAALAVVACSDDGSEPTTNSLVGATTTAATAPAAAPATSEPDAAGVAPESSVGIDESPDAPSSTTDTGEAPAPTEPPAPPPVVGEPRVAAVEVARFESPVDLVARPGDDALYVVEQRGQVVRFREGESSSVADVSGRLDSGGERGLLGLEFSADGALAYLDYTDRSGDTTIAEYPVDADGNFDTDAERVLLVVDQPYSNHNAGDLELGPDGTLYVTLGDGGSGGDPERRASDPTSLLGSLLRIDPTPTAERPYSIPPDNPFASGDFDGIAGAPEVWAWGLRNPWKIDIDPVNGDLWIADVGQSQFEEVDRVPAVGGATGGRGADFGWSAFEGNERFNSDVPDRDDLVQPVLTYEHINGGRSISGGVVYRGNEIAELAPAFVYSDYFIGTIWAFDPATERNLTLLEGFDQVTAVRTGPDGEIYVLEGSGAVHRLVAG